MKVNLHKDKRFLINTVGLFISFVIFIIFLFTINYDWSDEGKYGMLTGMIYQLTGSIFFDGKLNIDYLAKKIFITILPLILLIITLIYIVIMILAMIKKEKNIKFSSLIFFNTSYLLLVIYAFILDLTWFSKERINVYLSSIFLIPIFIYLINNLVSTIIYYKNNKIK